MTEEAMTARFTLQIKDAKGADTRLFFPGLHAIQPDTASILGNLGSYFYASSGRNFDLAGSGTFGHPAAYGNDLTGYVNGMTLSHGAYKPVLMQLSIVLDDASDGDGGAPINSFMQLTPDSLLNPTAAMTDVRFNVLGGAGNDKIFGSDYGDFLSGKGGRDLLTGYGGADTFFFAGAGKGDRDHVADFKHKLDTVQIDDTVFTGLANESLSKAFHDITKGGMKSEQADDRLLYDRGNGLLYYDYDGNKAHGAKPEVIAVFDNHPHLGVGDFDVSF
jgi:Ca2+-binding RTX toxin-like protein